MPINPTRCIPAKPVLFASFLLVLMSAGTFLPEAIAHIEGQSRGATFAINGPSQTSQPDKWQQASRALVTVADSPASTAATFVVNDNGDAADSSIGNGICDTSAAAGDQCTLRAAIQEANSVAGDDTINFSITGTINLTGALPSLTTNMTINGPGSALLTVRRNSGGDYRIFTVPPTTTTSTIAISGLTVTNGRTSDTAVDEREGGGIRNAGALTLTDVSVVGNSTGAGSNGVSFGGGGGRGGGIFNSGTLTMANCSVTGNSSGNGGNGGNGAGHGGDGGGVYSSNSLTMTDCTVSGNACGNAGSVGGNGVGGSGGGIFTEAGSFILSNVNVSNNSAGAGNANDLGGGSGGGIHMLAGTGMITNSTVSNNHSGDSPPAGSRGAAGGIESGGALTILGSTISNNDGRLAGGIVNRRPLIMINSTVSGNLEAGIVASDSTSTTGLTNCTITGNTGVGVFISPLQGPLFFRNNIIAGNGTGGNGRDTSGGFNSQGHNFVGNGDGGTGFTAIGDQVGTTVPPTRSASGPACEQWWSDTDSCTA